MHITIKKYCKAKEIVEEYEKQNFKKVYVDFGLGCYFEAYFHSIQTLNTPTFCGEYNIYVKEEKLVSLLLDNINNYLPCKNKINVYNKKQSYMKIICN